MSDRCRGECCRRIMLFQGPNAIGIEAAAKADPEHPDFKEIAHLFREVGWDREGRPIHKCLALLPNGDCGVYETRPRLCRDYPYAKKCDNPGCQWAAVCAIQENDVSMEAR